MKRPRQSRDSMEAEFEQFVAASAASLRRTAYLMCGDWHRAEDIVQTALTKLYVHWSRIDHESGPGPYARRAVVNAVIDDSRRPWRREHSTDRLPDRPTEDRAATWVEWDEMAQALAHLPAGRRAVVVLRYADDVDVETTAGLLGITPDTVKSQAARGLAALRDHLSAATPAVRKE